MLILALCSTGVAVTLAFVGIGAWIGATSVRGQCSDSSRFSYDKCVSASGVAKDIAVGFAVGAAVLGAVAVVAFARFVIHQREVQTTPFGSDLASSSAFEGLPPPPTSNLP
jgi:hypothetical protein